MYYKPSNAILRQPMIGDIGVFRYPLKGFYEIIASLFLDKRGIEDYTIGYNNKKYEYLEKLYSMAYTNINALEKNYVVANAALDEIAKLEDNWNDNGASPFSPKLIEKCREILMQLVAEPFICPTACGSIQFEYEKENGEYLEFEIYEDRIEVFRDTALNGEEELNLQGISATDKMKQMVVDFYG